MNTSFILFFFIFGALFLYICRQKNLLIDYKLEKHKRFSSKSKSNSIGGILLIFYFIFQYIYLSKEFYLLALLALITIIGFMSDIKKLNNVGFRFFLQLVLIIFFISILDYKIISTKIDFFDNILKNQFFNIFFVTFCLMVLINGSNFIDGLNGLLIKYNLIIYLIIYFVFSDNLNIDKDFVINLILVLSFLLILNLLGYLYLGDSGAYLISLFTGLYLIEFSSDNSFISPYLVIIFLWYPCFELLFSIIRRSNKSKKAYKPDTFHLHQYIYFYVKKKLDNVNYLLSHFISSFLINFYNLIIFIISLNFMYNSEILIYILVINITVYLLTYKILKKKLETI